MAKLILLLFLALFTSHASGQHTNFKEVCEFSQGMCDSIRSAERTTTASGTPKGSPSNVPYFRSMMKPQSYKVNPILLSMITI